MSITHETDPCCNFPTCHLVLTLNHSNIRTHVRSICSVARVFVFVSTRWALWRFLFVVVTQGIPGDIRTARELRFQISSDLETQLRVFYSLLQKDASRAGSRSSSSTTLPTYFGYLPGSLRPLS